MALAQFDIGIERVGKKCSAEIIVYETKEELVESIVEYEKQYGVAKDKSLYTAEAITHNFIIYKKDNGIAEKTNIVRFTKDVGASVLAHEMLHVACHMYRQFFTGVNLGRECDEKEEILAYILSDLTYQTATSFLAKGIW